jgi:hypothetical protein
MIKWWGSKKEQIPIKKVQTHHVIVDCTTGKIEDHGWQDWDIPCKVCGK